MDLYSLLHVSTLCQSAKCALAKAKICYLVLGPFWWVLGTKIDGSPFARQNIFNTYAAHAHATHAEHAVHELFVICSSNSVPVPTTKFEIFLPTTPSRKCVALFFNFY